MSKLYHITVYVLNIFLVIIFVSCAPRYIEETKTDSLPKDYAEIVPTDFKSELIQIINRPEFNHTIPSVFIMSADSGDILFSHYSDLLVRPASNQKILTSAAALHHLGANYNFRTILYHSGPIEQGVLKGDLILKGFGDPLLTNPHLKEMVDALSLFGIYSIEGGVIIDDTFFDDNYWPSGWMWDDEPHPYVPFLSPLSINKNIVTFTIERDANNPTDYRINAEPNSSEIKYKIEVDEEQHSPTILARVLPDRNESTNSYIIQVNPNAPSYFQRSSVTVRDPAMFTGDLFTNYLIDNGLMRTKKLKRGTIDSLSIPMIQINTPIIKVLEEMNKYSDNLSAELVLKTLGAFIYGTPGSGRKGSQAIKDALTDLGISAHDLRIADGSGVSYYNLVTARTIGEILYALYHHDDIHLFQSFHKSLSIMGVDGTLASRLTLNPNRGKIRGRTGTLTGISSFSGYVETSEGETLIFVMLFQNFTAPPTRYRQIQDEICELLIRFNRHTHNVVTH